MSRGGLKAKTESEIIAAPIEILQTMYHTNRNRQ
jgi:hypothetical protein